MTKPPALQEAILAHLSGAGRPESSRELATRFLRIRQGDEATCHRLLAPLLHGVAGVVYEAEAGWSYARPARPAPLVPAEPAPAEPQPGAPSDRPALGDFVALASEGGGPGGSGAVVAVSLLPFIAGEECQEEHLPGDPYEDEVLDGGPEPGRPRAGTGLTPAVLSDLVEAVGELPVVCHRAGREVEPLRRACAAAGLPFHPRVISAARLGHLLHGLKANHAAADLAAALGIETRGPDDCRGRVRIVAESYLRMLPALEERGIDSLDALLEFQEMPAAPLDLSGYAFSEADLRALPAAPGVYRFLDRQGEVIYAGKAKNLRARVASYFTPSARGTAKGRAILEQVHELRVQEAASDLEAALLEAALLSGERPRLNRQFEVHERPAPYGPRLSLAVVLPDRGDRHEASPTCTIHLLSGGRYLGRVAGLASARAGGPASARLERAWSEAIERLADAYFPGRSGQGSAAERALGTEIDWHLVSSYLRAHRDEVNVLDLDECPTPEAAIARLRVLVEAASGARGRVLAR